MPQHDTHSAQGDAGPAPTGMALHAGDALLAVDLQCDFLPGGPLAVPGGETVVEAVNGWLARFHALGLPTYASRDWHPADHSSFRAQGGPWPPHCVAGTPGAEFAGTLHLPPGTGIVSKGVARGSAGYSAFEGTDLHRRLQARGVRRLFVAGLATDYCVLRSAMDALDLGYAVVVLGGAVAAVDVQPGDGARALARLQAAGATLAEGSVPVV